MPVSVGAISARLGDKLVYQGTATATADTDVTAAAASVYVVDIDNTLNSTPVYLKLYDTASVTTGTTAIVGCYKGEPSSRTIYHITAGIAFGTALSFACTKEAGSAGSTSPTNSVVVRLIVT